MGNTDDVNEERMRLLGRHLADLTMVETVEYFPIGKEDRVIGHFDSSYFPDVVDSASLEIRLRLNSEFNIQYVEEWSGEQWTCRWDRHPNTHNTRDHFHVPPTPREEGAVDATYPTGVNEVLRVVLETIEARLNELWATVPDSVYPTEYEFENHYEIDYLAE